MMRRCSRADCRTSLDEYAVTCPHGLPFCEHCTWEEGCTECSVAANVADIGGALDRALSAARDLREPAPPRVVVPCRCGAQEDRGRESRPVADLRGQDGVAEVVRVNSLRRCRTCPHGIHVGQSCVRWNPRERTSVIEDFYHRECVITS